MKAMEEVSGPVMAIAIILAAVFIPTAFIPGITGRLYQQFAVTIAVSVIISAFNALTLSARARRAAAPAQEARRAVRSRNFMTVFNKWFGRATDGYVGVCRLLIHKMGFFALILLAAFALLAGVLGTNHHTSFLPDEDQGYIFAGVQLPDASSAAAHQRSDAEGGGNSEETPGVKHYYHGRRLQHVERRAEHLQRAFSSSP